MQQLIDLFRGLDIKPTAVLDIGLTAILIYALFSLIRGTRAVRLILGVTVLYGVYLAAQLLGLPLLSQILQTGAVVGLLALVVVFQPELRRALERLGRVGSLSWLLTPASQGVAMRIASEVARSVATLAHDRRGALIIVERETGLEDAAEAGIMLHAELSAELLCTIFSPQAPLHDGAVIVRGEQVVAAGVVLPLSEILVHRERFGTRHRAALGITEQTDAVAVVVSEETGTVSLVERGRIVRNLDEDRLRAALFALLEPTSARGRVSFSLPTPRSNPDRRLRLRSVRARRGRPGQHAGAADAPSGVASPSPAGSGSVDTASAGVVAAAAAGATASGSASRMRRGRRVAGSGEKG